MKQMLMVLLLTLCAPWSRALAVGATPLQLSLWSPVQAFPRDWDVMGLRCSGIYAQNNQVYGLDVGLFNSAAASSGGLQLGVGNVVSSLGFGFIIFDAADAPLLNMDVIGSTHPYESYASYTGLQLSLLFNHADELRGLQFAGVGNRAVTLRGFQFALGANDSFMGAGAQVGLSNEAHRGFSGVQLGGVNACGGTLRGLQIGAANLCDGELHGLQIGLINYAYAGGMTGVQIGLLNFIWNNPVPFLPLINAHF